MSLLAASCSAAAPSPIARVDTLPEAPSAAPHAPVIRIALVGSPSNVNPWSLFDESGASYADLALHSGEYPSLYRLSLPAHRFESEFAEGLPSAPRPEGAFFAATVKLRNGLYWSDGSPLSSADVAFTANTALAFRLGLDWSSAYNPDALERVEAIDQLTVKFVFKQPFDVGDWQYGALQGPVLSQAYWSPKLIEPLSLLPRAELVAALEKLKTSLHDLQAQIDTDNRLLLASRPGIQAYNDLSTRITRNQNELNSLGSQATKLQDEYDAALSAARAALFSVSDAGEPVFGPFLPPQKNGELYTRKVNASYPFGKPNYDSASYRFYPDLAAAFAALEGGRVDLLLNSQSPSAVPNFSRGQANQDLHVAGFPTSSARFLAINPGNRTLADPALRRALSCALDRTALANALNALPLDGFVLSGAGDWKNAKAAPICTAADGTVGAVNILKARGYRWTREPSPEQAGEGLILPDGSPFPAIRLLAPSQQVDPQRAEAARLIGLALTRTLGMTVSVEYLDAEDLRYAVYSSGEYELALLGWRLSEYPAYLCSWFQPPSPFAYQDEKLASACAAMGSTPDLGTARQAAYDVQAALSEALPFLPLYQGMGSEAWRGVSYPFGSILNGLSGIYGAPGLAVPAP